MHLPLPDVLPALEAADPLLFTLSSVHCVPRKPLCTSLLLCYCCLQLTVKPGEMSHPLCWVFAAPYHIKGGLIRPLTFFFTVPQGKASTSCPPWSLMTYWSCHPLWLPQTTSSTAPLLRPQKEQERQICPEFATYRKWRLSNRTWLPLRWQCAQLLTLSQCYSLSH